MKSANVKMRPPDIRPGGRMSGRYTNSGLSQVIDKEKDGSDL